MWCWSRGGGESKWLNVAERVSQEVVRQMRETMKSRVTIPYSGAPRRTALSLLQVLS